MKTIQFLVMSFFLPVLLMAQSVSDPRFEVRLEHTLFPGKDGPLIFFDQHHYNAFSLSGQYKGFADVAKAEGYRLEDHKTVISAENLAKANVFVTVNALSHPSDWDLPNASIYSEEEIETLYRWVHDDGGGLFIITDEMPSAGAVGSLAERFGFNVINGVTHRMDGQAELFNREIGNLLPSAVTDREGRKINQVRCWVGSGFIPPQEAEVFSILGDAYRLYLPSKTKDMEHTIQPDIPYISGVNLANGALLKCGNGRVCIFADASPFTALLKGINSEKRGMNHMDAQDHVGLLRNILEWLSQP
ncbi:hypothetical protein [Sphingobacterium corticibacterium]|uniref:DUF4350 domain-containing protein n=1 Tax=Sphingobacterium corticibacterium TaxID=2484746 RepID=A0A4Q6XN13_9SPHI|nr:hypothetical protein [Sphingobacterium corticibacterium]RZF61523.1 hypothetical protein EWE74_01375 [Sphingobacterium corticibacterium]